MLATGLLRRSHRWLLMTSFAYALVVSAPAATPLPDEDPSTESRIRDADLLLALDTESGRSGRLHILEEETLDYLGQLTVGIGAQMAVTTDRQKVLLGGTYYSRGFRGQRTDVIEQYDIATLTFDRELVIPPKRAVLAPMRPAMLASPDGRRVLLQNVTPAASVTVVDIANWTVLTEVPNPGCFGVYPVPSRPSAFATLCADGSLTVIDVEDDGKFRELSRTLPFFDPQDDPVFVHAESIGDQLAFISFRGMISFIDLSGGAAVVRRTVSMAGGIEGDWRPGGYQVIASDARGATMFLSLIHI